MLILLNDHSQIHTSDLTTVMTCVARPDLTDRLMIVEQAMYPTWHDRTHGPDD